MNHCVLFRFIKNNKKSFKVQRAGGYTYNDDLTNINIETLTWFAPENLNYKKLTHIEILRN